jgi:hypothetical protein
MNHADRAEQAQCRQTSAPHAFSTVMIATFSLLELIGELGELGDFLNGQENSKAHARGTL